MNRMVGRPLAVVVAVVLSGAILVGVGAFADEQVDIGFSHLGATPQPNCQAASSRQSGLGATPVAMQGTPEPIAVGTDATPVAGDGLAHLNLRLEAAPENDVTADRGLPHSLRLYTVRLPAGGPGGEIGQAMCRVGFSLIYVAAGEVEITHHLGLNGTGPELAGMVSYTKNDEERPRALAAGESVQIGAGGAIFLEQAVFSARNAGTEEALLLVSGVTLEWLPCSGGGCN